MANTKSTQHEVDLTSELNLNKFKADIKPYAGFNERNSPYYGGCLSPLYIRDLNEAGSFTKYYKGHRWECRDGKLYKDNVEVWNDGGSGEYFSKIKVSNISGFENKNILNFLDTDNYIEERSSKIIVHNHGTEHVISNVNNYVTSKYSFISNRNQNYNIDFVVVLATATDNTYDVFYNSYSNLNEIASFQVHDFSSEIFNTLYVGVTSRFIQLNLMIYDKQNLEFIGLTCSSPSDEYPCFFSGDNTSNEVHVINLIGRYWRKRSSRYTTGYEFVNSILSKDTIGNDFTFDSEGSNIKQSKEYYIPVIFLVGRTGDDSKEYAVTSSFTYHIGDDFDVRAYGISCGLVDLSNPEIVEFRFDSYYYYKYKCLKLPNFVSDFNLTNEINSRKIKIGIKSNNNYSLMKAISRIDETQMCQSVITECKNHINNHFGLFTVVEEDGEEVMSTPGSYFSYADNFRIIYDHYGNPQSISYYEDKIVTGSLLTSWGSIKAVNTPSQKNIISYYDQDAGSWIMLKHEQSSGNYDFTFIGDFIVLNTNNYFNCLDVNTNQQFHWASDYRNRYNNGGSDYNYFSTTPFTNFPGTNKLFVSSGINLNWKYDIPPSIKTGGPFNVYGTNEASIRPDYLPRKDDKKGVDIYIENAYSSSYRLINNDYDSIYNYTDDELAGQPFPGGEARYNIPLLFNTVQGPLDATIINFGSNVSFNTIYYDNKERYQYYGNSITEFENYFIIQGQLYGVANNKIYSLVYANGVAESSTPVTNIEGLTFAGNTIYNAYFYSETSRVIYSFGADNNLSVLTQADTLTGVTGSSYVPSTGSLIIGTPECTYVLNERFGIYRINEIKRLKYVSQSQNTLIFVTDDHAYEMSYEKQGTEDGWIKQDIILDTSFYGAGSNVVSVNDCWYVRITDPDHGTGEVKLAVSTLTDIGRTTETKTVKVKATDWDELTDTVYIRFQPKLQRAVGVSLHVESPFKVGYIGVGATPETLQLNKVNI